MNFDLLGALASILSTYYFIRLDIKAWPIGLVATSINAWLYFEKGIFADAGLELFYFISIFYGWYQWQTSLQKSRSQPVKQLPLKHFALLTSIAGLLFTLIFIFLSTWTDSTVAKLDAFTTSLSMIAQGLMCYKIITTWVVWFIVDAVFAYLYLQKHLPFHALLMMVYTGMAVAGYLSWHKQIIPRTNRPRPLSN